MPNPNVGNAFRDEEGGIALINMSGNCFGGLAAVLSPIAFAGKDYSAMWRHSRRTVIFGFPESK